jgi:putative protease
MVCLLKLERHGDYLRIEVKNRFVVGDSLELMTPQGNITFTLTALACGKLRMSRA